MNVIMHASHSKHEMPAVPRVKEALIHTFFCEFSYSGVFESLHYKFVSVLFCVDSVFFSLEIKGYFTLSQ